MNVKIPKEQYDKLRKIKEDLGLNMQEVISIALNIYFKKIENANSNG